MSSEPGPIPLCVPNLGGNEWTYVRECLDTGWVSYVGPFVERFERELAARAGAAHAVATASGTAALHTALLLAGVAPGDAVVMPGLTFVAPANAVRYCGAWPVFTDIRADDGQWDADRLDDFLARACVRRGDRLEDRRTGRRIAALLPVHLLGGMGDADAWAEIATRHGLPLVEDAAECLGATRNGGPIGAPRASYRGPLRLVATSFNGNKIITTGGGGALLTDDPALARRARHLTTTAKADPVEFLHDEVGYNYRMTNLAAAVGVAQLERLTPLVEAKRAIAARYAGALAGHPGVEAPHPEPRDCRSTFWMYTLRLRRPARPVVDRLIARGIQCRPLWKPLPTLPAFQDPALDAGTAECRRQYAHGISLPCSTALAPAEQDRVIAALLDALAAPA